MLVGLQPGVGEGGAAGGDGELGEAVHAAPVAGADVGGGVEDGAGHAQAVLVGAQPPPLPPGLPQRLQAVAGGGQGGAPGDDDLLGGGRGGDGEAPSRGPAEGDAGIRAGEGEVVGQGGVHGQFAAGVGDRVQAALGVGAGEVGGRRGGLFDQGLDGDDGLDRAGRASRWPIIDLELLRAVFWAASPNAARTALDSAESFLGVPVPWPLM